MALRLRKHILMPIRSFAAAADQGAQESGERMWMLLSIFVAIPGCAFAYVNAKRRDAAADVHHNRPEFVPYPHLRLRSKKFPWGDGTHSFFHNPHLNPLPDGYEE